MQVNSLQLRNYRNYITLDLALDPGINVFIGQNAQGKTNILEAIYYAALARSHRTSTDSDLIHWNARDSLVRIAFSRLGAPNSLELQFSRDKRRRILAGGQAIRPKDLIGRINTVLFSPEDLFLVKGAPAGRRRFLDSEISQASPTYYQNLKEYTRIVTQRNTLLKKIKDRQAGADMLDLWDAQLVDHAVKIWLKRLEAVRKLNMLANLMQRRISNCLENLAVIYEIHGAEGDVTKELASWYNRVLREKRELDIIRGTTSRGPHHDDLVLAVNGINLRSFGSQGQQRTGVLSLKLAELEFLRSETGEYPVLLLDDVMSELDASRRRELLEFIRRERIQTIITATEAAYFPDRGFGTYFAVQQGTVQRVTPV